MRSFIKPDLFDNTVPFDNIIHILSDQSALEIRVTIESDLELHYFSIFTENNENEHLISANFTEDNTLLKERTQTSNNKIKLHILGVPMNQLVA